MKIAIIGTGYVGLVSGLCLAKIGHEVVCIDKNQEKISDLNCGIIPIYEPGLADLLSEMQKNQRISFKTNLLEGLKDCEALFIAVGTPQDENGEADLSGVFGVINEIKEIANQPNLERLKLLVIKSTVPVGTNQKASEILNKAHKDRFLLASNPEFLREGQAINDFMNPDLILIGANHEASKQMMLKIYQNFCQNLSAEKIFSTDITTAELVKYGINSFLATKICFINEMANLCEKTGANIDDLAKAIGQDARIGNQFLKPGPGFGGSCFPKDISALLAIAKNHQTSLCVVDSVHSSNQQRIELMIEKIRKATDGNLANKKIAFFGLAFKAGTDDIRSSPAIKIATSLAKNGAKISAHDFCAINNSKAEFLRQNLTSINCFEDCLEATIDADLLVVATEWPQYRELDFAKIKSLMRGNLIFDLRNILPRRKLIELGFEVHFIGGKTNKN